KLTEKQAKNIQAQNTKIRKVIQNTTNIEFLTLVQQNSNLTRILEQLPPMFMKTINGEALDLDQLDQHLPFLTKNELEVLKISTLENYFNTAVSALEQKIKEIDLKSLEAVEPFESKLADINKKYQQVYLSQNYSKLLADDWSVESQYLKGL